MRTKKFGVKQLEEGEMSGDGRNPVVPVDVVSGNVQQLSEVPAYNAGVDGYETFGGRDYTIAGVENEAYYDGGGGVGGSRYEKRESGSGG